ncbi:two-component system sensor histidine kinase NtrB [Deferrisoma sp.]
MSKRVLVVEDSEFLGRLVVERLTAHGYECSLAADGLEGLKRFTDTLPDAVVLDLNLPRLHGLDVLRQIKRIHPETVVVVLTGHGSERTAMKALRLGANDYITKPFREDILLKSLQIHLTRAELQAYIHSEAPLPPQVEAHVLARVFFDAPTALLHVDPQNRVVAANRAAARLLARRVEDLVGVPAEGFVCPELRCRWMERVREEAASPGGYEGEVFLEGPTGRFPAAVAAVERPEPGHLILALRDLTHQKALEKRYLESKKLASLGRVVDGVAHEVRNPLITIGGFARKLRRRLDGRPEGKYLDVIVSEVERLERMVQDIEDYVAFSRERTPRFAPVHLGGILEDCIGRLAGRAEAQGVRVRFEAPEDLPAVYGDAELLTDLFGGLLENAIEAMPAGGDLFVDFRPVENWVQVRIRDTGVGIDPEDLEEIFDPFFTSKTSGTGLGLARAHLIVEEHGGTIEFESQPGRGTVCTVALPIDRRRIPRGEPR